MDNQDNAPGPAEEPVIADQPRQREPIFNIPAILMVLIGLMLALYGVQSQVMSFATQNDFLTYFSFRPQVYGVDGHAGASAWIGPVSYSLLHGSLTHVGFNSVWLAVFGTPLARRLSLISFILFWFASAVASAFFFAMTTGFEPAFLIGASGVVSATSGAVSRFAITQSGFSPGRQSHLAPRLSILGALTRRPVQVFVAFSLISNLLIGIGFSASPGDGSVAWQAHIGGFLFGYLFFGLFDRRIH